MNLNCQKVKFNIYFLAGEFKFQWFSRYNMSENQAMRSRGRYFVSHQDDLIAIEAPPEGLDLIDTGVNEDWSQGFALISGKEIVRHSEEQIKFVRYHFDEGKILHLYFCSNLPTFLESFLTKRPKMS